MESKGIDNFVDNFFIIPYRNFNFKNKKEVKKHERYLKEKYGWKIFNEYMLLGKKLLQDNSEEAYHELNAFAFKTGIYLDGTPDSALRTKETLGLLLHYFSRPDRLNSFSLADFGSGDGMVALGLAIYLDHLKKVYTIELNPEANKLIKSNLKRYSKKKAGLAEKISIIEGDYRNEETLNKILKSEPKGMDFALAAYPFDLLEVLNSMKKIIKEGGTILTCFPCSYNGTPDDLEDAINSVLYWHEKAKRDDNLDLNFTAIANIKYEPGNLFVLTEGKR